MTPQSSACSMRSSRKRRAKAPRIFISSHLNRPLWCVSAWTARCAMWCAPRQRITLRVGGRLVDVRVSTLPTGHGERAVLRLLEKDAQRLNLDTLGMAADTQRQFDTLITRPHGIVLVTGPTGSGKTTTLYAALSRLETETANIMTVEDPIEYDLPKLSQTQVNERIGMSFARALRSILRQDPDV